MSAPRTLGDFLTDRSGAAAVEFTLVALVFLGLMLGIIDISRLLWELNSAKAATRAAVRMAVVSSPVAEDLVDYDAITALGLAAGSPVPVSAGIPTYTCTGTSGSATCSTGAGDFATFDAIVQHMQGYYGRIEHQNVVVEYLPVGLGFAGNPYGPDVEPLVTVRITGVQFAPGILQAFGLDPFNLPSVASSLSGEDLA